MRVFNADQNYHMPFVFENTLLFCRADNKPFPLGQEPSTKEVMYQPYDIYYSRLDGTGVTYIGAEGGQDVIACSPNAYRSSDGEIVLNYVAVDTSRAGSVYTHYQRIGPTLDSLRGRVEVPNKSGYGLYCEAECESFRYSVFKAGVWSRLLEYDKEKSQSRVWTLHGATLIKRAVVHRDRTVVVCCASPDRQERSVLLDCSTGAVLDLSVDGKDLYKACTIGSEAYYAVRSSGAGYGMSIHRGEFSLLPSEISATASAWQESESGSA